MRALAVRPLARRGLKDSRHVHAAICLQHGPPAGIVVQDIADPVAGPGKVVVDVHAAAVNFPDVLLIAGSYQVTLEPPFTCGSEFSGVVRALGPGVSDVHVGDRVFGATLNGAFAERVVVPVNSVSPIPAELDYVGAAAMYVTYATAFHSLITIGNGRPGDVVVVLGASGGVGLATVDIASRLAMRVIAITSSEERAKLCREHGADFVVDHSRDDVKARVKEFSGGGADIVVDPVGGPLAEATLRATRWGGRFVSVGFASGEVPRIPLNLVLLKGVVLRGFEGRTLDRHVPGSGAHASAALAQLVKGGMRPHISKVYSLDETADALSAVNARKHAGKVVIKVAD
ncbi:MAG: 2-haloacrylate reductase [Mycobacterium sp.]|nr:2-haloacrylate reductase [Mycobacterium sp.]